MGFELVILSRIIWQLMEEIKINEQLWLSLHNCTNFYLWSKKTLVATWHKTTDVWLTNSNTVWMEQRDTQEKNGILYRIWRSFFLNKANNFFRISVFSNVIAVIVWNYYELKLKKHSKPRIQLFCVKPVLGYLDFSFARFKCLHSQIQDTKGCEPFF